MLLFVAAKSNQKAAHHSNSHN